MRISDWSSDVCSSDLAGAAGPGDSPYRASDRSGRATIALPAIQAGRPVPLRLARGTLERAWHDGKFHVALPGGGHYSVALEEQRLEPDGRWTDVALVPTRLRAPAMVRPFGPDAVFGLLLPPDGTLTHHPHSPGNTQTTAP